MPKVKDKPAVKKRGRPKKDVSIEEKPVESFDPDATPEVEVKEKEVVTEEPKKVEKPKRKYKRKSAVKLTEDDLQIVSLILKEVFDFVATRAGEHWKPNADELGRMTTVTSKLVIKWAPSFDKYAEEIAFISVMLFYINKKAAINIKAKRNQSRQLEEMVDDGVGIPATDFPRQSDEVLQPPIDTKEKDKREKIG